MSEEKKNAVKLEDQLLDNVAGGTGENNTGTYPISTNGHCPVCGGDALDRWGYADYPYSLYECECGTVFKRIDDPAAHPLQPKDE